MKALIDNRKSRLTHSNSLGCFIVSDLYICFVSILRAFHSRWVHTVGAGHSRGLSGLNTMNRVMVLGLRKQQLSGSGSSLVIIS
jgi:hypothetical protein